MNGRGPSGFRSGCIWGTDPAKCGTPKGILAPAQKEEAVLSYWWYDEDRSEELDRSIREGGFLPTVPEIVGDGI